MEAIIPTDRNKQTGWIYYWLNLYPYGNYSSIERIDIEHIIIDEAGF